MGKKRIFFNILRNKTFQLVWSTLKSSFKSKPSILVLKKIENYSMKFYFKVKSLKLFLFNYANNETYSRTPHFILTI
jgi:ribosomal protein S8